LALTRDYDPIGVKLRAKFTYYHALRCSQTTVS
jgi:hypothetical protein